MKQLKISALLFFLLGVATLGCFKRPAVRLEKNGLSIVVHVETLGEYPTTIREIRITDTSSGKVVLKLVAEQGTPQIYSFRLSAGDNPAHIADPEHGSYRVEEPYGKDTFILQPGIKYRLTIWGDAGPATQANLSF